MNKPSSNNKQRTNIELNDHDFVVVVVDVVDENFFAGTSTPGVCVYISISISILLLLLFGHASMDNRKKNNNNNRNGQ